jgi:FtsZ-binding cell division protein ZapB
LIKRPIRQPTLAEIFDELSLLHMEINDLRENQQDMENQINQIKRLIE